MDMPILAWFQILRCSKIKWLYLPFSYAARLIKLKPTNLVFFLQNLFNNWLGTYRIIFTDVRCHYHTILPVWFFHVFLMIWVKSWFNRELKIHREVKLKSYFYLDWSSKVVFISIDWSNTFLFLVNWTKNGNCGFWWRTMPKKILNETDVF